MGMMPTYTPEKLRGGYYTPTEVANWLTKWAIRSPENQVLEPSCGDGVFLKSAIAELQRRQTLFNKNQANVVAIELNSGEADKARGIAPKFIDVITSDFFQWHSSQTRQFDVVVGNPPFIRYQNFPEPSRTMAMKLMQDFGFRPNRLTNIWVPFVVASVSLLRENGRLAMVLPAELLQVTYAAQLRQFLVDSFQKLTVFACNEIFFEGAEQEVVLLAAEDKLSAANPNNVCKVAFIEAESIRELTRVSADTKRRQGVTKTIRHDSEKWLKYFLDNNEITLMRRLREHIEIETLSSHASIDVGVVTGKNEFFVMSKTQVDDYELSDYIIRIVGRSAQLPGTVISASDHRELSEAGNRVFLLNITTDDLRDTPSGLRRMIREGEEKGFHKGYKCSIRDPWYKVPSLWQPDCFFFRQIYDFPRVVVNKAKATSTDTIHRMKCSAPADKVAANLYTHLTAASAEIEGRSYGGGVLELEPTEAERLLVPRTLNGAMPIAEADNLVRQGRLDYVLDENDRLVLRESLGLSVRECGLLKKIWTKMRDRRASRGKGYAE